MVHNTLWRAVLGIVVLLFFAGVGVAQVANPDWFVARSGMRKGGEMLTPWNQSGVRFAGLIETTAVTYILYEILCDMFRR
jgi:hypothetical protein